MDKLKLSLQGYNYGNGYITWAIRKHGAIVKPMHCSFPRNRQPPMDGQGMAIRSMYHVLRYYSGGGLFAGLFGKGQLVTIAKSQLGNEGGPEVLVVVGIHRATRMVCLFRVLVCRPGRTHSKRCGAKIFCLYGREELVSKPRKMAGGR